MIGMSEQLTCRDRERDISEKIVLGLPDSNARSGEVQFDQRLFDQSMVRSLLLFFKFSSIRVHFRGFYMHTAMTSLFFRKEAREIRIVEK